MEMTLPIANGLLHTPSQCGPPKTPDVTSSSPRNICTVFKSQQGLLVPAPWRDIVNWFNTSPNHLPSGWMITLLNMLVQGQDYQLEDIFFC